MAHRPRTILQRDLEDDLQNLARQRRAHLLDVGQRLGAAFRVTGFVAV
jgi:hypothetical protein